MAEGKDKREPGTRSGMRPHEEFLELCAISTTGELTEEEQRTLQEHLADCAECRGALKEFEASADFAVPLLASDLAASPAPEELSIPEKKTETKRVATPVEFTPERRVSAKIEQPASHLVSHRDSRSLTHVNWNYVWLPFVAAVLLMVALGIYSYQDGRRSGLEVAQVKSQAVRATAETKVGALERQMSDLDHERELWKSQMGERDRKIEALDRQIENQSSSLAKIKSLQASLQAKLQSDQASKSQFSQQRNNLTQELNATQAALHKTQAELVFVRQRRIQDQLHTSDLDNRIAHLSAELRDRERTISEQQQMLRYDRDIRDLIAARNLYIAEVYDVAGDGKTRKPFGRIFYTKGKSLIFYAYDLDQQPGVKTTSTFQAWGQRGLDKHQALNLGVFYQDNVNGKRWVLKVDNPHMLEQIDAVFVTLEQHGPSRRPSGKPLLYAYLRIKPNLP